jgi:hypothetical protein
MMLEQQPVRISLAVFLSFWQEKALILKTLQGICQNSVGRLFKA